MEAKEEEEYDVFGKRQFGFVCVILESLSVCRASKDDCVFRERTETECG